ncbi:MAG: hypothetical protein LBN04_03320 [Oscillospiraceae bacterium]|jgi:hypothetical protein|nr:hypothetical protein [Oscillospiraceae bacterium]
MKKWIAGALLCILLLGSAGALAQTVTLDSVYYSEGTYVGYVADGLPNGYGVFIFNTGANYSGMFKDGKISGYGIYFMDQVANTPYLLLAGVFENFEINGEGALLTTTGQRTAGQFVNSMPVQGATQTSRGEYTATSLTYNGATYGGEVLAANPSIPHGYGVLTMDYATGSADDCSQMFIGEVANGNPRNGVYLEVYSDEYWLWMVTDGELGEAVQTTYTLSEAVQQSNTPYQGAGCGTCWDSQICQSCKGATMLPGLLGGYGECVSCRASGLCRDCNELPCWTCRGSRICKNCKGAGEYNPIPYLAYMKGAEPVRCGICSGTGVCPFCR